MPIERTTGGTSLIDVLDRVLDKGLLIAGDIRVSLAEVELLTIRIRLIVCSLDKAQEVGLDWWKHDTYLAPGARPLASENEALRKQVVALERRVSALSGSRPPRRRPNIPRPPRTAPLSTARRRIIDAR